MNNNLISTASRRSIGGLWRLLRGKAYTTRHAKIYSIYKKRRHAECLENMILFFCDFVVVHSANIQLGAGRRGNYFISITSEPKPNQMYARPLCFAYYYYHYFFRGISHSSYAYLHNNAEKGTAIKRFSFWNAGILLKKVKKKWKTRKKREFKSVFFSSYIFRPWL